MQHTQRFLPAFALLALILAPQASLAQQRIELEGRVSRVDGTRIELSGGLVALEARGAEFEAGNDILRGVSDLTSGTAVEIIASVQPDGSMTATEIEINNEKNPEDSIKGVVSAVDQAARSFTIGPLMIYFDDATRLKKLSAIQSGSFVEATLDVSDGRLRATLVEREKPND
ncbi:MAG: DUF5666 domain-containing protein [Acidobacteria bacterium]|nr:DUF5666 domain-containing protein [Acidobacteriota bacterium]MDA1235958.1 DUF5666 domain-containing protein [Acidobacteriota bacterium]